MELPGKPKDDPFTGVSQLIDYCERHPGQVLDLAGGRVIQQFDRRPVDGVPLLCDGCQFHRQDRLAVAIRQVPERFGRLGETAGRVEHPPIRRGRELWWERDFPDTDGVVTDRCLRIHRADAGMRVIAENVPAHPADERTM